MEEFITNERLNSAVSKGIDDFRKNIGLQSCYDQDIKQHSVNLHPQASPVPALRESLWSVLTCSSKENATETLAFIMSLRSEQGDDCTIESSSQEKRQKQQHGIQVNSFVNELKTFSPYKKRHTREAPSNSLAQKVSCDELESMNNHDMIIDENQTDSQSTLVSLDSDDTGSSGSNLDFRYPHDPTSFSSFSTMLESSASTSSCFTSLNSSQSSLRHSKDEESYKSSKSSTSTFESKRRKYHRHDSFAKSTALTLDDAVDRKHSIVHCVPDLPTESAKSHYSKPNSIDSLQRSTCRPVSENPFLYISPSESPAIESTKAQSSKGNRISSKSLVGIFPLQFLASHGSSSFGSSKQSSRRGRSRSKKKTYQGRGKLTASDTMKKARENMFPTVSPGTGRTTSSNSFQQVHESFSSTDNSQSIFPNDSRANEVAIFEEKKKFSTIHVPPGRTGFALKSSKHGPLILSVSSKSVCPSLQPRDIIVTVDRENVSAFIEFGDASYRFVLFPTCANFIFAFLLFR